MDCNTRTAILNAFPPAVQAPGTRIYTWVEWGAPYGRTVVRVRPNQHSQRIGPPSSADWFPCQREKTSLPKGVSNPGLDPESYALPLRHTGSTMFIWRAVNSTVWIPFLYMFQCPAYCGVVLSDTVQPRHLRWVKMRLKIFPNCISQLWFWVVNDTLPELRHYEYGWDLKQNAMNQE